MKKLTKYTPEKTFTIEKNGFHGTYYKAGKELCLSVQASALQNSQSLSLVRQSH